MHKIADDMIKYLQRQKWLTLYFSFRLDTHISQCLVGVKMLVEFGETLAGRASADQPHLSFQGQGLALSIFLVTLMQKRFSSIQIWIEFANKILPWTGAAEGRPQSCAKRRPLGSWPWRCRCNPCWSQHPSRSWPALTPAGLLKTNRRRYKCQEMWAARPLPVLGSQVPPPRSENFHFGVGPFAIFFF